MNRFPETHEDTFKCRKCHATMTGLEAAQSNYQHACGGVLFNISPEVEASHETGKLGLGATLSGAAQSRITDFPEKKEA